MSRILPILAAASIAVLSGCSTDAYQRNEGVTGYAGNAIAANTVMQMVDPWQRGVEDTNLKTGAERLAEQTKEAAKEKEPKAATDTTD